MTNLQEDDNGSQGQLLSPGEISGSVPDEKPEPMASDSYNQVGGDLPSFLFTGTPNRLKTKRKPLDWMAIASDAARTRLMAVIGVCFTLIGGFFIILVGTLLIDWLWSFDAIGKIGTVLILIALIGAAAGALHGYNKQRNP